MSPERIHELAMSTAQMHSLNPHVDDVAKAIEQAIRTALDEALSEKPSNAMLVSGNKSALSLDVLMDNTRFACEHATYKAMSAEKRKQWSAPKESEGE